MENEAENEAERSHSWKSICLPAGETATATAMTDPHTAHAFDLTDPRARGE